MRAGSSYRILGLFVPTHPAGIGPEQLLVQAWLEDPA